MDRLGEIFTSLKQKNDDDAIDRLNYYYTVYLLLGFSITIAYKEAVGQPVNCWVPAEFTGGWEKYAENYCYVENTYWVHMNHSLPDGLPQREEKKITYYQWVPFMLALQALLFHIPHLFWQGFNWQSGLNVQEISSMATDSTNILEANRDKTVKTIVQNIEDTCSVQKHLKKSEKTRDLISGCFTSKGYYVTGVYLVSKFLFLLNIFAQFAIMNRFIGSKYAFWGAQVLRDLVMGVEWEESGHFPRVTMCDFDIRSLGHIRHFSVQCVLMINMFIEKIYIFIWWWIAVVAALTIVNTLWWCLQSILTGQRVRFVEQYIRAAIMANSTGRAGRPSLTEAAVGDVDVLRKFVRSSLRCDGVLVLRILSSNAGDIITSQIVAEMWDNFQKRNETTVTKMNHPDAKMGYPDSKLDHASSPTDDSGDFSGAGTGSTIDICENGHKGKMD